MSWVSNFRIILPIIEELNKLGQECVLYHKYNPNWRNSGKKSSSHLTSQKIKRMLEVADLNVKKIVSWEKREALYKALKTCNISKLIGVDIGGWQSDLCDKNIDIKTYSISYLVDFLWSPNNYPTRVYHTTEYIMRFQQNLKKILYNSDRDKCLGSPLFDKHKFDVKNRDITILLPSWREKQIKTAFGNKIGLYPELIKKIIQTNTDDDNYFVFKTRAKHWVPSGVLDLADEIIIDNYPLYIQETSNCFDRSYTTIMFNSTGIFEAVLSGNFIINIPIKWQKSPFFDDRGDGLYSFDGVVQSLSLPKILSGKQKVEPKHIDATAQKQWIEKFVGDIPVNSAEAITLDILSH